MKIGCNTARYAESNMWAQCLLLSWEMCQVLRVALPPTADCSSSYGLETQT
jgi:hypothetical protein